MRYQDLRNGLVASVRSQHAIAHRVEATVLAAHPTGRVELAWRDRTTSISADLVVGADGSRSTVRAGGHFGVRRAFDDGADLSDLVPREGQVIDAEAVTALGRFGVSAVDVGTTYFTPRPTHLGSRPPSATMASPRSSASGLERSRPRAR
jgi:2-polyprenyl-6-methoxyphenol hydroxylase-like FAD-dependent oxidoreductase